MDIGTLLDFLVATKEVWVPLLAAGLSWLAQSKLVAKLPKSAREWLGRIEEQNLLDAVAEADAVVDATPEQRRQMVVERISCEVQNNWNLRIPTSVANMLAEYGYQLYRKLRKKG